MLDFSKQRSSTVNWIDTLAPQFQQAIKDEHAIVGMDSEMVLAAMGRPEHKVRERDTEGRDTEDWIYGTPPSPHHLLANLSKATPSSASSNTTDGLSGTRTIPPVFVPTAGKPDWVRTIRKQAFAASASSDAACKGTA